MSDQLSYEKVYKQFSWEKCVEEYLDWAPRGNFNIAHEAIDRHAAGPEKVAIYTIGADGRESKYTFRELQQLTSKLANVLRNLGVQKGDRVARMLPRTVETYITFFASWKLGAVDVPIFTAYGPDAVAYRVKDAEAKVLITDEDNRPKLEEIAGDLDGVKIVVVSDGNGGLREGDYDFWREMSQASPEFAPVKKKADDLLVIHYTSGTTGKPKGVMVAESSVMYTIPFARYALDIRPDEMFWGFADPGWIYGLITVGTSLLLMGNSVLLLNGKLDAQRWYKIMESYGVTSFSAAPTLYRQIMAAGDDLPRLYRLKVRRFTSGGEYLDPKVNEWFRERIGVGISDQYGLTEVGMVLGNYPFQPEKVGSMGRPLPGFDVRLLDEDGREAPQGETGIISVKKNDFFLGKGYWKEPEKWQRCFVGDWYSTSDLAVKDSDGYFFYRGRNDDVISSAGYRIGPAEVEAAVMKHPSVAEVAAVGKADPLRVEIVKAFVVLKDGYKPSEDLAKEIQALVKTQYSAHLYPREIEFLPELPKTESGKIMRRELRKRP